MSAPAAARVAGPPAVPGVSRVAVGVVLVNWKGLHDTIDCIASLADAAPTAARVAVVDNASGDGSPAAVERWARDRSLSVRRLSESEARDSAAPESWLTIIEGRTNAGFSGGNNLGLMHLAADPALEHFLLLNNDTTIAPDFFEELLAATKVSGRVGLATGTIYERDGKRVWYAGGIARPLRALIEHRREPPVSVAPADTEFVCGCVMLITREALEVLGPLPDCYFPGFCEDVEYSYRARRHGFRLVYAPLARVTHKVGASFGSAEERPSAAFALVRHRAFFVRRNLRGWRRILALAYLVATKPGRAVVETARGRPRLGWAIVRGLAAGLLSGAARR